MACVYEVKLGETTRSGNIARLMIRACGNFRLCDISHEIASIDWAQGFANMYFDFVKLEIQLNRWREKRRFLGQDSPRFILISFACIPEGPTCLRYAAYLPKVTHRKPKISHNSFTRTFLTTIVLSLARLPTLLRSFHSAWPPQTQINSPNLQFSTSQTISSASTADCSPACQTPPL